MPRELGGGFERRHRGRLLDDERLVEVEQQRGRHLTKSSSLSG
jgi:hypothetical protein